MRTSAKSSHRKTKKRYTLSPESVAFLETLRKSRRAASTSSVLEEILPFARRREHCASIENAVTAYYSSLSPEEAAEQEEWGDFALRNFPSGS